MLVIDGESEAKGMSLSSGSADGSLGISSCFGSSERVEILLCSSGVLERSWEIATSMAGVQVKSC